MNLVHVSLGTISQQQEQGLDVGVSRDALMK